MQMELFKYILLYFFRAFYCHLSLFHYAVIRVLFVSQVNDYPLPFRRPASHRKLFTISFQEASENRFHILQH